MKEAHIVCDKRTKTMYNGKAVMADGTLIIVYLPKSVVDDRKNEFQFKVTATVPPNILIKKKN